MTEAALQFADDDKIGRVASVDTSRVAIDVTNSVLLTRIGIGQLVAIRGATEREYLIAMTERATRNVREELPIPDDECCSPLSFGQTLSGFGGQAIRDELAG
ncbi:hypothetical protein K9U39_18080 [Rhodoblastus acidophilus]|uniref:Uncharacterized protein n=1 Tax=Candidatus Rhodoblastus alkanivorans TaxID=2954117 RepID=A0ABS9Z289_9HYPH|nr:hypothetical protein [Candidatus Rhodoblastus alkanivorans]MCI4680923.1 hypothetical protein [Candidatus Rhodoblastus alkanivorans]MCI4681769.1 hypothetical protein [Candidatus Rhodoblastus alkanivorans]MDI4642818.1 hypothetical protein [Rhodoblastus acidophilus]